MVRVDWPFDKDSKMGIYAIINKADGKIYVRSTKDLRRRWRDHLNCLRCNKHPNEYLQRAFNKYGEDNFEFRILQSVEDEEGLIPAEQHWLDSTQCYESNFGYNILPTADRSRISAETAAKISARGRGVVRSAETRAKIRSANIGKTLSDETRAKLRALNVGKTLPVEHRQKIGASLKGRFFSESHRAKIGAAWKGRQHTEATRQKMQGVNSPLTPEQVREIRRRYAAGESRQSLGTAFNVHPTTIWNIVRRKTWTLLSDEE